jgi:hypothetical protein
MLIEMLLENPKILLKWGRRAGTVIVTTDAAFVK